MAAKADIIKVAGRTVSASGNAPVSIYTADGRLIYQGAAEGYQLPSAGIYIIASGNAKSKVAVH